MLIFDNVEASIIKEIFLNKFSDQINFDYSLNFN